MARLQTKSRRQSPQVQPNIRHSPRGGLNAYTCSPRGSAFLSPSLAIPARGIARLASAPGGQAHTISRPRQTRSSAWPKPRCDPTRPPHPHPTYRDDRAYAPLGEAGWAESYTISVKTKEENLGFQKGLPLRIETEREMSFSARAISMRPAVLARLDRAISKADLPDDPNELCICRVRNCGA